MATLLIGQKRPTSGRILINGVDLTQLKTEALYEHVSLVSAHSHIFKGSIKENLLMAKRDATSEEVNQALEMARLDQFIAGLPKGLETEVSENGSSLSGGQKTTFSFSTCDFSES